MAGMVATEKLGRFVLGRRRGDLEALMVCQNSAPHGFQRVFNAIIPMRLVYVGDRAGDIFERPPAQPIDADGLVRLGPCRGREPNLVAEVNYLPSPPSERQLVAVVR